jgi:hypothetical protein
MGRRRHSISESPDLVCIYGPRFLIVIINLVAFFLALVASVWNSGLGFVSL